MARRHGKPLVATPGVVVIDSGATTACVKPGTARRHLLGLLHAGWAPIVPAATLSEALTAKTGKGTRANHLLASFGADGIAPCSEAVGMSAAALRQPALRNASPSGIDAIVAAPATD